VVVRAVHVHAKDGRVVLEEGDEIQVEVCVDKAEGEVFCNESVLKLCLSAPVLYRLLASIEERSTSMCHLLDDPPVNLRDHKSAKHAHRVEGHDDDRIDDTSCNSDKLSVILLKKHFDGHEGQHKCDDHDNLLGQGTQEEQTKRMQTRTDRDTQRFLFQEG
jgi:hypothetical protein